MIPATDGAWQRADILLSGSKVWRDGWARRDVYDAGGKYVPCWVNLDTGRLLESVRRDRVVFK